MNNRELIPILIGMFTSVMKTEKDLPIGFLHKGIEYKVGVHINEDDQKFIVYATNKGAIVAEVSMWGYTPS